jgi:hypothetical protein
MATANSRKTSADGAAAGKAAGKPRAASRPRAPRARAAAAAPALDSASSKALPAEPAKRVRSATPRAKAKPGPAAKGAAKAAPKAKRAPAAKKPAAKKAPARKVLPLGEPETVKPATAKSAAAKKVAAAKAPHAKASRPTTAKTRAVSKAQRPAVLNVASMAIDTLLAAELAAKTILSQAGRRMAPRKGANANSAPVPYEVTAHAPAPKRQSALLRELRESVTKPASHQLDNLLSGHGPQGPGNPFGGRQPFGRRAETEKKHEPHFGHYGVPRRAAG